MPQDLFRVTVDETNYSTVLGEPLTNHQKDLLRDQISMGQEVRIWAINTDSPAKNDYHRRMTTGDGLLFYKVERGLAPDEKMYVAIGEIGEKFETDKDTARELFQTPTATLMFTVENFEPIERSINDVEPILGYKQHPQRTQRVKPNRYESVNAVFTQLRH